MKTIAFCLVLLVVSNASLSAMFEKYPINFTPKRSIMTLLTQVEAKMKAGGPLDSITRELDNFVATVTEEQAIHDQLYAKQQVECTEEFGFREKEVSDATAAYKSATEQLDGCQQQYTRATNDLKITKKQLGQNREFLAQIEDTRRREAFAFESATESYQAVTKAIDEALVILEQIWSGESSFAQLAKHTNGMLKSAVKIRKAHFFAPVLSALVQLATSDIQADDGLLDRVRQSLGNLKQRVQNEYAETASQEQAAIEAYNEDKGRLVATIQHLSDQQEDLEGEITKLDQCIVNQFAIQNSAASKRDRNQTLLDDANNLCGSVDAEYNTASSQRKQELELLAAIRERVEARFAQLSDGVKARGQQDEFSYTNASPYTL